MPPLLFSPFRLPGKAYAAVFEQGRAVAGRGLLVRWLPNGQDKTRAGVVSPKRVFHLAVERSRVRRLMREAFRLERVRLITGVDLILMGRRGMLEMTCADVRRELLRLCKKASLMQGVKSAEAESRA